MQLAYFHDIGQHGRLPELLRPHPVASADFDDKLAFDRQTALDFIALIPGASGVD